VRTGEKVSGICEGRRRLGETHWENLANSLLVSSSVMPLLVEIVVSTEHRKITEDWDERSSILDGEE
jgi:hypothetical protein